MANGKNLDGSCCPIEAVDDSESPYSVLEVSVEFALERLSQTGIFSDCSNGLPNPAFKIRRQVTNPLRGRWKNARLVPKH